LGLSIYMQDNSKVMNEFWPDFLDRFGNE